MKTGKRKWVKGGSPERSGFDENLLKFGSGASRGGGKTKAKKKLLPSQKKSLEKVYKKIDKREAKEGVSPREDWGWRGKTKAKRPDVLKLSKKSSPLKKTKSILAAQKKTAAKKKKVIKRTSAGVAGAAAAGAASQWIDYKD